VPWVMSRRMEGKVDELLYPSFGRIGVGGDDFKALAFFETLIRHCCTNQVEAGLPLPADGFILRPLFWGCQAL
jgi:hypothetical protein